MIPFLRWLSETPVANAVVYSEWMFPAIETIHIIGFALLIGTIAIVDFRLLGLGMQRQPVSELAADLAPWTRAGFFVMLITGPLMFSAEGLRYYANDSFRFKMVCLLLAILFHLTAFRKVTRAGVSPIAAKAVAFVSLALWICVLAGGRMIAFV